MAAPSGNVVTTLNDRQIRLMHLASYASVVMALTLIALKLWAWNSTNSVALLSSLADSLLDLVAPRTASIGSATANPRGSRVSFRP